MGPVVTRGKNRYALASMLGSTLRHSTCASWTWSGRDTKTALSLTSLVGTPCVNFLVGDKAGNIGYSIRAACPADGFDGSVPVSWADGSKQLARSARTR